MKAPNNIDESDKLYLGKEFTTIRAVLIEKGIKFRVRSEDGVGRIGVADVNFNRLNFHLRDGKIVQVDRG